MVVQVIQRQLFESADRLAVNRVNAKRPEPVHQSFLSAIDQLAELDHRADLTRLIALQRLAEHDHVAPEPIDFLVGQMRKASENGAGLRGRAYTAGSSRYIDIRLERFEQAH